MLQQIFTLSFMTAFLAAAVRLAVPLMYGGIGETIAEKSGILNIGMEGVMLSGAFFSFAGAWNNNLFFALYPITISSIIPVNLLSYDEKSNWSLYACTFPCSRKEIVSSKYILTVCTLTLSAIIVEVVQTINMIIRHNFHISGLLTIFTIIFITGLLPPAFMFPFTFKLGAEKGRFAYYIGFILFFALLGSLQSVIKNLPLGLAHFPFRSYYILILLFIGLLLYMISWILSIKFYQNREF